MKIQKISAIAELVSAVAIVVTLGYLAVQTQQNTAAIEATVRQGMLAGDQQQLYQWIEHPNLNKRTNLTELEKVQVSAHITAFIRTRENHWLQYENGVLDESTWLSYRNAMIPVIFSSEYGRAVWNEFTLRGRFDQEFVRQINEWVFGLEIVDSDEVLPTPDVAK